MIEKCVELISLIRTITSPWQCHSFLDTSYSRTSFLNIIFTHDFSVPEILTILNILLSFKCKIRIWNCAGRLNVLG